VVATDIGRLCLTALHRGKCVSLLVGRLFALLERAFTTAGWVGMKTDHGTGDWRWRLEDFGRSDRADLGSLDKGFVVEDRISSAFYSSLSLIASQTKSEEISHQKSWSLLQCSKVASWLPYRRCSCQPGLPMVRLVRFRGQNHNQLFKFCLKLQLLIKNCLETIVIG